MVLMLITIISLIVLLFGSIMAAFIIATILDYRANIKQKSDIFYQLSRDHNRTKRPARK